MFKLVSTPFFRISSAHQVIVEYQDLVKGTDLKPIIEEAYGPKGYPFTIQVSEFCLSMEYLTIANREGKLFHFSTN